MLTSLHTTSGGYVHTGSSALEAGDSTFVFPNYPINPFPSYAPPTPANDNHVAERPRIIGLMGYAGSGKSTVATELVRQGYVHTKFAGPLKAMMRSLYAKAGRLPADIERRIEGDLKERPDALLQGRTPRQAMQWLGTNWGREFFGTDFWVGMWAAGLLPGVSYVVDDCRFANEAVAIRSRGGVIVQVSRPGVGPVNDHISEVFPTTPDVIINNDGSIEDLSNKVSAIAA